MQSQALSLILATRKAMIRYSSRESRWLARVGVLRRCLRFLCFAAIAGAIALVIILGVAPSYAAPRPLQASALQTYPERPAPSQSAIPGSLPKQQPAPEPPKTEQYTLSQDRYQKAVAYSRAEYVLYFVSYGLSVLVLVLFLRLGVAAKFRDLAENVSGNWFLQGLVFVPLFAVTLDLFDLPIRVIGHTLSRRYEQSVQGWGSWCWDWCKAEVLGTLFILLLVLILFGVMRWSPRRWWFYFWMAALPILLFIFFISPWFIDPLFNKFEALDAKHPELAGSIEKVVRRTNLAIPRERMFLMEASKKTNEINAYVTGFGASKRVVVWDTTIPKMTLDETLFVFGHEAGHYVLNHVRNGFLFFSFLLLVALYLGYRGLHWALARWGQDWKLYGAEDWASLAVILMLLQVMMFFAMPITNGFSRMQEHAADVYGLEVIHGIVPNSAEVAAHAFQIMGEIDLADPNPPAIITFWLYTHPPLAERLVFAHGYDPWAKGEPLKYLKSSER